MRERYLSHRIAGAFGLVLVLAILFSTVPPLAAAKSPIPVAWVAGTMTVVFIVITLISLLAIFRPGVVPRLVWMLEFGTALVMFLRIRGAI